MRKQIEEYCEAHGLKYYGLYTQQQAALHLCDVSGETEADVDTSSIKRWVKSGKLAYVRHGDKGVRFFGFQLAQFHIGNIVEVGWDGTERRVVQVAFEGPDRRKAS